MADSGICTIPGCGKPTKARGWCAMHYKRWSISGDPHVLKRTEKGAPKAWLQSHIKHDDNACLIWPFNRPKDGYGRIMVSKRCLLAHRVMCEIVYGPAPTSRHEAAHSCGKGSEGCVNPRHLYWATPTENQADRIKHGTSNRGERHGSAVLTERDVIEIRSLRGRLKQNEIAAMFGISRTCIRLIHSRKTWGWL